ncbi:MAG: putative toxin-antitoxin system toxin component, PIN family [Treponema sp.]|nr:putative toxin-antitoxin system toxin component, PIN family [Treponema sp.]
MKVVIDTNVLVSAFISAYGKPAQIISTLLNGKIKILYDNRIIFEYLKVLSRGIFKFDDEIINELIIYIHHEGEYVNADYSNAKFKDETDKKFYEVFKTGIADFLITGNKIYFPKENKIVSPNEFLETCL